MPWLLPLSSPLLPFPAPWKALISISSRGNLTHYSVQPMASARPPSAVTCLALKSSATLTTPSSSRPNSRGSHPSTAQTTAPNSDSDPHPTPASLLHSLFLGQLCLLALLQTILSSQILELSWCSCCSLFNFHLGHLPYHTRYYEDYSFPSSQPLFPLIIGTLRA